MNRLTNEQRLQVIEFYYQNACSVEKVHRALLPIYGQFNRPTEATIRSIVTKFRSKFTLLDITLLDHQHAYVESELKQISQLYRPVLIMTINYRWSRLPQLGYCCSTTCQILRKDFGVKPFKIQLVQELKPNDLPQCRIFGE